MSSNSQNTTKKNNPDLSPENAACDELIMTLSHYAGRLEESGKIVIDSWEDLEAALNDIVNTYYDGDNDGDMWAIAEKVYLERFVPLKGE